MDETSAVEENSVVGHGAAMAADAVHEDDGAFTRLAVMKISAKLRAGRTREGDFSISKGWRQRHCRLMRRDQE